MKNRGSFLPTGLATGEPTCFGDPKPDGPFCWLLDEEDEDDEDDDEDWEDDDDEDWEDDDELT